MLLKIDETLNSDKNREKNASIREFMDQILEKINGVDVAEPRNTLTTEREMTVAERNVVGNSR